MIFRTLRYRFRRKPPYRVYTRDFDEQVRASDLVLPDEGGNASSSEATALAAALRTALANAGERLRPDDQVIILVDQSGSLRGERIAIAAMIASTLGERLERAGVRHEVLGFTTRGWKGGQAREQWLLDSSAPNRPGRLCDLRHIIYKAMTDGPEWRTLLPVMTADILREGIDGEAVEWARGRFLAESSRKILIQVGDGSPNDDATLKHNGMWLLEDHFLETVADLPLAGIRYVLLNFVAWISPVPQQFLGAEPTTTAAAVARALDDLTA